MGKPIVYCGGCGQSLHEDDFDKGKAHLVDSRPFCADCRPPVEGNRSGKTSGALPAVGSPRSSKTSGSLPALQHPSHRSGKTSASLPAVQPSTRRSNKTSGSLPALKGSSTRAIPTIRPSTRRRFADGAGLPGGPMIAGGILVAAGLVVLVIFVALPSGHPAVEEPGFSGPPKPYVPAASAKPKVVESIPKPADVAADAIRDLETFATASTSPVAILQKCEEAAPKLKGTGLEPRLHAVEDRAKEMRRVQQLNSSLEEVGKLRALDPKYERKAEVVRLLNATLSIAGSRRGEVEEVIRLYEKEAEAFAAQPPPLVAPEGPTSHDIDPKGCVNHWLVLGPFGARPDIQALYDADLLKTEPGHVPEPGMTVLTREGVPVKWTPVTVNDGMLPFRKLDALGLVGKPVAPQIVFAACWIVADMEREVKFKVCAEQGFVLNFDHARLWNHPVSQPFAGPEDVVRVKLSPGPHLLLLKSFGAKEEFGLRLRVTELNGERARGLKILCERPAEPKVRRTLFAEFFNEGSGPFQNGKIVEGGVSGSKALEVSSKAVWADKIFRDPVTPETTIRFKVKPLFDSPTFEVMFWSEKINNNCWYHVRGLKAREWNVVEFKIAAARAGWNMDGPGLEGVVPYSLRFYFDHSDPTARALLDDVEILE